MKTKISKTHISLASLALSAIIAFALASPSETLAASPKEGAMMPPGQNAERYTAMKEHHEKMMTEMRDQDAELATQIAAIKKAPENKKMDLMVTLVSHMVEQRTTMHENMSEMMENMREDMPMKNRAMSSIQIMEGNSRQASSKVANDKE